jgi:hypothetical protein
MGRTHGDAVKDASLVQRFKSSRVQEFKGSRGSKVQALAPQVGSRRSLERASSKVQEFKVQEFKVQ